MILGSGHRRAILQNFNRTVRSTLCRNIAHFDDVIARKAPVIEIISDRSI